jgi:hypothetical protein
MANGQLAKAQNNEDGFVGVKNLQVTPVGYGQKLERKS